MPRRMHGMRAPGEFDRAVTTPRRLGTAPHLLLHKQVSESIKVILRQANLIVQSRRCAVSEQLRTFFCTSR